jgi:hypothetical protein
MLVMLQRVAVFVVFAGLVGASEAVCQSQRPLDSVVRTTQPGIPNASVEHRDTRPALPDAPSAAAANRFEACPDSVCGPQLTLNSAGKSGGVKGERPLGPVIAPVPPTFEQNLATVYETSPAQRESSDFLSKLLTTSQSGRNPRYRASLRDSLMARATDAASGILVTRDESGRRRLNTSYLVGVLTMVAAHSASRPYWARSGSASAPIGDFGSTVGNDAGMNLLHEFGPGLREAVTGHLPSFVFKIEQRVTGERNPRPATLNRAR